MNCKGDYAPTHKKHLHNIQFIQVSQVQISSYNLRSPWPRRGQRSEATQ